MYVVLMISSITDDHNNCKRIYDTMIEYQEKKILPYRQK